jgi:hypothetical protein
LKQLEDARAVEMEQSIMTEATSLANHLECIIYRIIGCQRSSAEFDFIQSEFRQSNPEYHLL